MTPTNSTSSGPSDAALVQRILNVPELLVLVCEHLERFELSVCSRVNKQWRAHFLPLVFRSVQVHTNQAGEMVPTLPSLRTFRSCIDKLRIKLPDTALFRGFVIDPSAKPLFPHVRSLVLQTPGPVSDLSVWIWNCPRMKRLHVSHVKGGEHDQDPSWHLDQCTDLIDIEIQSQSLTDKQLAAALVLQFHRVVIGAGNFRSQSFAALKSIADSLIELNLWHCSFITPRGQRSLLCACSNLVVVHIVILNVNDFFVADSNVAEGDEQNPIELPCSLKEFHVRHWMLSMNSARNQALNECLESLELLEKWHILEIIAFDDNPDHKLFKPGCSWALRRKCHVTIIPPWMREVWPKLTNYRLKHWRVCQP